MKLSYDLHIHSCLSPCGDDDMTPGNIVGMAMLKELDVIALTDHNSCKNCPAFMKLAEAYGILAIPGMEINTSEEVHVVCLFPKLYQAMAFDEYVYERLMPFPNREEIFGKQEVYNEEDEVIGNEQYLLINTVDISIDELWDIVHSYEGIIIPAHIDKEANSLLYNLGFVPPDSKFRAVEIKNLEKAEKITADNPYLKDCRIISSSDAHYLQDIQEAIHFIEVEERSVRHVLAALEKYDSLAAL